MDAIAKRVKSVCVSMVRSSEAQIGNLRFPTDFRDIRKSVVLAIEPIR